MTKGQKIAVGITVGIPLVCCLGGIGVMQGVFGRAAATRDQELDLARRDGLPTTAAEITEMTRVPDGENAAPDYQKVVDLDRPGTPLSKDLKLISQGFSRTAKPADRQSALAALPRVQGALALMRKGAAFPHCDFHRDWALGANVRFTEYSPLKDMCRALCLDAESRSDAGDWQGALDDLTASERVSHHIGEEPILIGLLVSIAIEAITERAFQQIIDRHSRDAAFLAAAKKVHDGFGPVGDFRRAIAGELALGRTMLKQVRGLSDLDPSGSSGPPNPVEKTLFQSSMVQGAFDAKLVRTYRRLYEALPKDPSRWEEGLRATADSEHETESDTSVVGRASQVMVPEFSNAAETIGMELTHRNLTDTALRLLLDRARTGALPRFLPDYGASRMDPFSGNKLIYRREGKGFILYSVGRDRVDDGGKEQSGDSFGTTGYDEVFRVH